MKRHHKKLYAELDGGMVKRYMSRQGESGFAMVTPSESGQRLDAMAG